MLDASSVTGLTSLEIHGYEVGQATVRIFVENHHRLSALTSLSLSVSGQEEEVDEELDREFGRLFPFADLAQRYEEAGE